MSTLRQRYGLSESDPLPCKSSDALQDEPRPPPADHKIAPPAAKHQPTSPPVPSTSSPLDLLSSVSLTNPHGSGSVEVRALQQQHQERKQQTKKTPNTEQPDPKTSTPIVSPSRVPSDSNPGALAQRAMSSLDALISASSQSIGVDISAAKEPAAPSDLLCSISANSVESWYVGTTGKKYGKESSRSPSLQFHARTRSFEETSPCDNSSDGKELQVGSTTKPKAAAISKRKEEAIMKVELEKIKAELDDRAELYRRSSSRRNMSKEGEESDDSDFIDTQSDEPENAGHELGVLDLPRGVTMRPSGKWVRVLDAHFFVLFHSTISWDLSHSIASGTVFCRAFTLHWSLRYQTGSCQGL